MKALHLIVHQVRAEDRAFRRNPTAAFFTFTFPLLFLVLVAGAPDLGGLDGTRFYVPAIATFSVVNACFTAVAMNVALARDHGVLKRVHGTPMPMWTWLVARMVHSTIVAGALVVIVIAVGALLLQVPLPLTGVPVLVVAVILGAACCCALGLAVAGIIPNAAAAPAVVNAIALPLYVVSDVFVQLDAGSPLAAIGSLFPVAHLARLLHVAWTPDLAGFDIVDLLWLVGWGVAGLLLAVRTFRWEPRT
ncbi:MAG: ABC transporter permease [Chloroflexi bacterium]|nr:ABC transporter permease [Chloroflexota bacterium]